LNFLVQFFSNAKTVFQSSFVLVEVKATTPTTAAASRFCLARCSGAKAGVLVVFIGLDFIFIGFSNYAKFYSRSHDAVIRVYDAAGNVIETHGPAGGFKEW
jgi:hypothetical protein